MIMSHGFMFFCLCVCVCAEDASERENMTQRKVVKRKLSSKSAVYGVSEGNLWVI